MSGSSDAAWSSPHFLIRASRGIGNRRQGGGRVSDIEAFRQTSQGCPDYRLGDLAHLPFDDGAFDLAVCALALSHLPDPAPAIAELARVLRPGGALVVSDLHPTMLLLGGTGFFVDASGCAGNVRSFHHPHARYLAAFRRAG